MKQGNKITKRERNERLTNWYMINLCWGVLGILALNGVYHGYRNASSILMMQPLMWVLVGVFTLSGLIWFGLAKSKKFQNASRLNNYAIFSGVCALVSLWLALYNKLRPMLESVLQTLTGNTELMVSSYWNVWIPMIAIGSYLAIAFIWYAVKVTRK